MTTNEERLNLRARQLLDDPTLSQNQRIPNASALLKHLAESLARTPGRRSALLAEITDQSVRDAMDAALTELGG